MTCFKPFLQDWKKKVHCNFPSFYALGASLDDMASHSEKYVWSKNLSKLPDLSLENVETFVKINSKTPKASDNRGFTLYDGGYVHQYEGEYSRCKFTILHNLGLTGADPEKRGGGGALFHKFWPLAPMVLYYENAPSPSPQKRKRNLLPILV